MERINTMNGILLFSYLSKHNNWQEMIDKGITIDKFHDEEDIATYKFFENYVSKYGHTPQWEVLLSDFNGDFRVHEFVGDFDELIDRVLADDFQFRILNGIGDFKRAYDGGSSHEDRIKACRTLVDNFEALVDKSSEQTFTNGDELCEISQTYYDKTLDDDIIPCGLTDLNEIIGGWDKSSDYAVVAGRPGNGKSMLLCKFAAEALKENKRVGYYSGEMPCHKVFERILTAIYGISSAGIFKRDKRVTFEMEYKEDLNQFKKNYSKNLFITETKDFGNAYPTTDQLATFCRRCNLDILFVDQHSLLTDSEHAKVPYERAFNISRQLKAMKDKVGIPVIAAVQRNRTKDEGDEVSLSSIAGSDGIGQDATKVIAIEKKTAEDSDSTTCTLYVIKNRFGRQGKVKYDVNFDKGTWDAVKEIGKKVESSESFGTTPF